MRWLPIAVLTMFAGPVLAADFVVVNQDGAGEGLNDSTAPAFPGE